MVRWRARRWLAAGLLPLALGCGGFGDEYGGALTEVPERPTYDEHIRLILETNDRCTECHVVPPNNGAPPTFRLDQYDGDGQRVGVYAMAFDIVARAVNCTPKCMPPAPRPGLSQIEKDTLVKWVDDGRPEN